MKTLYLDCFSGLSGEMTTGALLDLELEPDLLQNELAKLGVAGYELSYTRVDRSGIPATEFEVRRSYAGEIEGELVTPTGAAIAATLATEFTRLPLVRIEKVGYGAGARTHDKFPNVLRTVLCQSENESSLSEKARRRGAP